MVVKKSAPAIILQFNFPTHSFYLFNNNFTFHFSYPCFVSGATSNYYFYTFMYNMA